MKIKRSYEIALLTGCAAIALGCAPLYAPRLEGRLSDARTGEPVAAAEVFTGRQFSVASFGEPSSSLGAQRWTTTDSDGRFHFDKQRINWLFPYFAARVSSGPLVYLVDRRYGAFYLTLPDDEERWMSLSFQVSPQPASLRYFEHRRGYSMLCSGWGEAACRRICDIAYGPKPHQPDERVAHYCEVGAP